MTRMLAALAALAALLCAPAAARAAAGQPDGSFGHRGTVTLKVPSGDAVGSAVKVLSGGAVLAGGSAGGRLVVVKLRKTGSLQSTFGNSGQVVPALPGTSMDGVRALATFRDGRIVAAGTLTPTGGGPTHMVVIRLLPTGEVDPSFGGGLGYVLAGADGSILDAMTMDRNGAIYLAGSRPGAGGGEAPIVIKLAPDGTLDPTFAGAGVLEVSALGLAGAATSILVRPTGTVAFTVAPPSGGGTFTVVRLNPNGTGDTTFGLNGIASLTLSPGIGAGIGAQVVRDGPRGTYLVAGSDVTDKGSLRGDVIRLTSSGALDTRFGRKGIARVSRAGREIQITSMVRDKSGRIVLAGTGGPPGVMVVRLRGNGVRDKSFGSGGITFPVLGLPPGGEPVFTTVCGIDASGSRTVIAGAAAGPGVLVREPGQTLYTGRFALTVSRLH